jgi:acyl-CoA reductase-like NAD-dependent aldehyde dehydrogenase
LQIITQCESVSTGRSSREVKDLDVANIIKTLYYYAGSIDFETEDYESVGVVAIATYFDSSLLSLVSKLAPALACGNSVLLVPHKLSPLGVYMLMDILSQSGVPNGVVNLVANG